MKKLFPLLLLVLLLAACSPTFAANLVELPEPISLAILSLVTLIVGWLFAEIAKALPFLDGFLREYADEVAMAISGALVLAVQNWLNAIPPEWEGVANAALALVVAILAAIGAIKTLRKARVPGFRS